MEIELLRADVSSLKVDAIINPASASKPVAEFGSVPVGHAVVTSGGNVLCKFVIHAIVPRTATAMRTRSCATPIWAALKRAEELAIASVAMPPVPAVFGFDPAAAGACSSRPRSTSGRTRARCSASSSAPSANKTIASCDACLEELDRVIPAGQIFVIGDSHIGLVRRQRERRSSPGSTASRRCSRARSTSTAISFTT